MEKDVLKDSETLSDRLSDANRLSTTDSDWKVEIDSLAKIEVLNDSETDSETLADTD